MQITMQDFMTLMARRERYLEDLNGKSTSLAEEQAFAYALGQRRALHDIKTNEMRLLLEHIIREHCSGLPKATRARIAAVL